MKVQKTKVKKTLYGWGLIRGSKLRCYGFTDCLGMIATQPCIWPTKRLAKDMSIKCELPIKIKILVSAL